MFSRRKGCSNGSRKWLTDLPLSMTRHGTEGSAEAPFVEGSQLDSYVSDSAADHLRDLGGSPLGCEPCGDPYTQKLKANATVAPA
jgi:hypothetical protein